MDSKSALQRVRQEIVGLCYAGLDSRTLRIEVFERLQRAVPHVVYWCATTDPETLLYTSAVMRGITPSVIPAFLNNEFYGTDVNTFTELARRRTPVSTLYDATRGEPRRSARFREILEPVGLGNEMRVALRAGKSVWGAVCLHRELRGPDFTAPEVAFVSQITPHLATGLRVAALLRAADEPDVVDTPLSESPGLVVLADDLSLVALTPAAEWRLAEIGDWPRGDELPQSVYGVAARLQTLERQQRERASGRSGGMALMAPRARVRGRSGQWLALHASRLTGAAAAGQIAVVIEPARPAEVASLTLLAYALTEREAQVARLVLQGASTGAISEALTISELTVQQHLKAIFDKVGVRSRRELVARIFARRHWPRMASDMGVPASAWPAEG